VESKAIPEAAREILDDRPTGHLATIRPDGLLSVNPVSVLFNGEHVQLSTVTSRAKYKNMAADPRIAISIPHRNNPNFYLELRGRALIEPDSDRSFIDRIAQTYLDKQTYPFDPPGTERVVVTVIAEQVSMRKVPLADSSPGAPDAPHESR
jgi:PPOX class probable F420-dependent enzyme